MHTETPRLLKTIIATIIATACATTCVRAADLNVSEITIQDLRAGYAAGTYSAEAVTQAFLNRIAMYDPSYNAFISMNPHVLDDARAIDRRRALGETLGPLAGVPVVVKETIDVAGLPTTGSWGPLSSHAGGIDIFPEKDAPVVARLRSAGALILGKTNTPPFATDGSRADRSWKGPTYNAIDRRFVPGASSSGTATAVSANFAVAGLAEETGGSIQNPAAAQELVAIKPTFALVPSTGVIPLSGSARDVVGVHAKTVYDAALMLDSLAGYTIEDPKTVAAIGHVPVGGYTSRLNTSFLRGRRIGLYGLGWRQQEPSPETQVLYKRAIAEVKARGAIAVSDPFAGSGFADLAPPGINPNRDPRGFETFAYDYEKYLQHLGPSAPVHSIREVEAVTKIGLLDADGPFGFRSDAERKKILEAGILDVSHPDVPPDLSAFVQAREKYLRIFNQVMSAHHLDALVFPQMLKETPLEACTELIDAATVAQIDIAGLPAVIVPAGVYQSGAPFALIFVGRMWSEPELLAMAYDYEMATKHRKPPTLTNTSEAK